MKSCQMRRCPGTGEVPAVYESMKILLEESTLSYNVSFISLGCAKNQVDCERMMYRVQEAGHSVEYELPGCDVVVINTCGFIDSAKSEAIDAILAVAQLKEQGLVG